MKQTLVLLAGLVLALGSHHAVAAQPRQGSMQDNRVERSHLDAVVRHKDSTEVQAQRNRATDAPTVPEVTDEVKKQP